MKRCWVGLSLLFVSPMLFAASLDSKINRTSIYDNESFSLTLSIDKNATTQPDLSVLKKDFTIHGISRNNQVSVVNGETQAVTRWVISLLPNKTGTLEIPAIHYEGLTSSALSMTVKSAQELPQSTSDKSAFLDVSVAPAGNAYVQEQLTYTVKLYILPNAIMSASMVPPSVAGAELQQLPGEKQYSVTVSGKTYNVQEIYFAIFPKTPGTLTIQAPLIKAVDVSQVMQQGGYHSFLNTQGELVQFTGKTISLNALPVPSSFDKKWWLPARDVTVTEVWSAAPDNFHVGDAITRTISVTAKGALAAQLPSVDLESNESVSVYPDQAVLNSVVDDQMIVSTRSQKFAIVPNVAGTVTLPAISLRWWNVEKGEVAWAGLPEKVMTVLPSPVSAIPTPVAPTVAAAAAPVEHWFGVAIALFVTWVVTLLLWIITTWRNRRLNSQPIRVQAAKEKSLHRGLVSAIKKACADNNPQETKNTLLAWGQVFWPVKKPSAMGQIAHLLNNDAFTVQVEQLNAALYQEGAVAWEGKAFWQAFEACFATTQKTKNTQTDLPTLY